MNLENVLEMWKKDNVIDEMALDESSRETAKLHSKYLELYSTSKLRLKQLELEFKVLLKDKFNHLPNVKYAESIEKAIKSIKLNRGDILIITGSLYLCSEVLK